MDKVAACVLHGNDFVIRMQRGIRYRFTIERVNGDLYSFQSGQYDVSSFAVYRAVVCCVICYTGTAGSQGNVVYGYACNRLFLFFHGSLTVCVYYRPVGRAGGLLWSIR